MALPQSLTHFKFVMHSGDSAHNDATPTMVLMTSLPSICGTTLKTTTVESKANATRTMGVSRAVPARELLLPFVRGEGVMLRRSESWWRKVDSRSSMGVCSAIQER